MGGTPLSAFVSATKIKTPQEDGASIVPFDLWPAQRDVLAHMEHEKLLVILKARQLGISWLACVYVLWLCTQAPGKTVLLFSQGLLEANELIERIAFMYYQHSITLPTLVTENTQELAWDNGSMVKSLPATKKAGRSFSASLVIFDEFAFMLWGSSLYAAAKPTIDDGGKLWIISSADGQGSAYHQFWEHAKAGANGFKHVFLSWDKRPSRLEEDDWRGRKLLESYGDTATVLREYPANDIEAFAAAAGLVYDVWSDGPEDGNVTDAAEYIADGGPIYWAVDDGYEGLLDRNTGHFTANSSPRVFLLVQEKADGHLDVFAESYKVKALSNDHIADVQELGYPAPDYAAVDSAAAELRGRLHQLGIYTQGKPHRIEESIKAMRRMLAADQNGVRRIRVHPRCQHLRWEMASYRRDDKGEPIDALNHGPDALRYLAWSKRYDE